jgi:hypothetical protein
MPNFDPRRLPDLVRRPIVTEKAYSPDGAEQIHF